jgi:CRP-like cAMP-binding protein
MLDKNLIAELNIFSDIIHKKLEVLIQGWDLLEFQTNDIIFHQDDTATNLYGILDGEVESSIVIKDKILKADVEYEEAIHTRTEIIEKPIVVDTVERGEVFGWSSLVSPRQWTATARCSRIS